MPADSEIEAQGEVIDVKPSMFIVRLDGPAGQTVTTYLSGKMRKFSIKVVLGDRVTVALSPYDLSKGRITRRG